MISSSIFKNIFEFNNLDYYIYAGDIKVSSILHSIFIYCRPNLRIERKILNHRPKQEE